MFQIPTEASPALLALSAIPLLILLIMYRTFKLRRRKSVSANMVGGVAEAIDGLFPGADGYVLYQNEYWRARTDVPIHPKSKVRIIQSEGRLLQVKPLEETGGEQPSSQPEQDKERGRS